MKTINKYYLGVDGGGTKTKFTLCRSAGDSAQGTDPLIVDPRNSIVTEYTSSCIHYLQVGFDGIEDLLREGISKVCQQAGDDPATGVIGFSPNNITRGFFGLAGYADVVSDDPKIEAAVHKAVDGAFPYGIGNDCENALAGALNGKPGINIIAGTGSIGCGRDEHGGFHRCGGWHHVLGGDEGSAYWIAHQLLHHFQRQSDGREEKTALYEAVVDALSLSSDDVLVTRVVEEWDLDRTRIASLSPIVSRLASAGDPRAKEILAGAASELADLAIAIRGRLNFNGDVPVSGTGGVFSIGSDIIEPFDSILRKNGMRFVQPLYEPNLGSVLLAAAE